MSSNKIKAYTYHLYCKPIDKHYYGVRYSNIKKGWTPKQDLWNHYFSSSKKVRALIKEFGIEAFDYEIRKEFDDKKSALAWEFEVLRRLKVIENDKWLNECIYPPRRPKSAYTIATSETREKMAKAKLIYDYVFTNIRTNEIHHSKNLNQFCKDNNLQQGGMYNVVHGKNYQHKGWIGYIVGKEYLRKEVEARHLNPKPHVSKNDYLITTPSNEKLKFNSLRVFCLAYDIKYSTALSVALGKFYSHRGWKIEIVGKEYLREKTEERRKLKEDSRNK